MNRFFLWLSGVDRDILARCTNLRHSEGTRFAAIGALVLVPAVLGLFSMAYAVSTLAGSPVIYAGAGAAWAAIVLLIDRYLVSTIYKPTLGRGSGRRQFGAIAVRYVFAVVIGVAVAHPFVLLWFNSSIIQTIDQNRRDAVATRLEQAETDKRQVDDGAPAQVSLSQLLQERSLRVELRDCLVRLQLIEQSNGPSVELPCGRTSGLASCGPRCINIGTRIEDVSREILQFDEQIADARAVDRQESATRQQQQSDIDSRARANVEEIESSFSYDYLARVDALSQLWDNNRHVLYVTLFVIALFVFVDVMPITMKLATPTGEYEEIRDTALMERKATESAQRDVIRSGVTQHAIAATSAAGQKILTETSAIANVAMEVTRQYDRHRAAFESQLRNLRARCGADPEQQVVVEPHIVAMREADNQAWVSNFARVMEYLKRA